MANEQVGVKLTLDANDGIKSLKDLKNQIKEAKGDLIAMADKFGETSEQARAAAKRVAELEDAIGDSKTLIDQFNPDKKFNAFAQSINGVLGGFSALQGAMGLLGVESEDLQKQLLKVQSAMALSQGLNQVLESGNAIRNFGKTLVDTLGRNGLIGVAIAGVGVLTAYIGGLFDRTNKLAESEAELGKATVEAKKQMALLANTIQQAKAGVGSKEEALKQYNATLGQVTGKTNDLNTAEKLMAENADKYVQVQGLKAQANFLLQQSAEKSAQAELLRMKLAEEDLPKFLRNNLEKQIQADLDGLKTYDTAVQSINERIKQVKFSVTTTGLGASLGGGAKKDTPAVTAKKEEADQLSGYEKLIRTIELDAEAKRQKDMMDKHMRSRELITDQNSEIIKLNVDLHSQLEQLDRARTENENYNAEQRQLMAEQEAAARIQAAQSVGNAFGALADLLGRQTAAGKALAIAQATINTWVGVTEVLRAKSTLPEPLGTISKIANVAAIVATGINAIKNISKTKVPGGGGGGGTAATSPTVNAPLTPQIGVTSTQLNQSQLNRLGNATTRAYVVESDVSGNQERIRRLNRAARLG